MLNPYDLQKRSDNWSKRTALFDLYSRNLQAVKQHPLVETKPDLPDIFLCPLCFRYFTRDEVVVDDELLLPATIEDVPPKSVGGRPRTLTCKECNSWAGHALDYHLARKLQLMDFTQAIPGARLEGRMRVNDEIDLAAILRVGEDRHLTIQFDGGRSNPKSITRFLQLSFGGQTSTVDLAFRSRRGHRDRRPECSLLRIAYLWGFSIFGYGFLLNANFPIIRGQIKNPEEHILPAWGIAEQCAYPNSMLGVNIVTAPADLQSILVVFNLFTGLREIRCAVMLPGPSKPCAELYDAIARAEASEGDVPVTFVHLPDLKEFLSNPDAAFAFHDLWREHTSKRPDGKLNT